MPSHDTITKLKKIEVALDMAGGTPGYQVLPSLCDCRSEL